MSIYISKCNYSITNSGTIEIKVGINILKLLKVLGWERVELESEFTSQKQEYKSITLSY